ncbi:glucosaminidase domain-containing protein [Thalassotalea hakodatensis]|uniref:glucosaminidase domain-containing protein n=1 Tax=Thalassotalea hakodatensis TaxID=3030492 RepID=UPI0025736FC4|nr:glucosaminidase domain-containing protein [Thalassotalea hakodatensis]
MLLKYRAAIVAVATLLLCILIVFFYYSQQKDEPLPPMTVKEKKARFIALILPAVDTVYAKLQMRYEDIKAMIDNGQSHDRIEKLKEEYKVTSNEALLIALKPHPKSIAIAQAAMESSWATSRFFRKANNVFGVWSFNEDEPRIAALQKRGDKTIWVKKYSTIEEAVFDYYRTLGRGRAFSEFRQLNATTDDPLALVTKLDQYSEKGSEYGEELADIIEYNNFDRFDEH